jgi:hypothetical protein
MAMMTAGFLGELLPEDMISAFSWYLLDQLFAIPRPRTLLDEGARARFSDRVSGLPTIAPAACQRQ